jgi:hypothetical protein
MLWHGHCFLLNQFSKTKTWEGRKTNGDRIATEITIQKDVTVPNSLYERFTEVLWRQPEKKEKTNIMKKYVVMLTIALTVFLGLRVMPLFAQMNGEGGMTNGGGFGMMNGMDATPVVGDDGKAYLVSWKPNQNPGTMPSSNSFQSTLMAIDPDTGQVVSLLLDGMISRPVLSDDGNVLVATASLPNFTDFYMFGNLGESNAESQSVLYVVNLPFTESTLPIAVSLDGSYASVPVIANGAFYVTTSSRGDFMMGRDMFDGMFNNFHFENLGNQASFLYVVGFDGALKAKIQIE